MQVEEEVSNININSNDDDDDDDDADDDNDNDAYLEDWITHDDYVVANNEINEYCFLFLISASHHYLSYKLLDRFVSRFREYIFQSRLKE